MQVRLHRSGRDAERLGDVCHRVAADVVEADAAALLGWQRAHGGEQVEVGGHQERRVRGPERREDLLAAATVAAAVGEPVHGDAAHPPSGVVESTHARPAALGLEEGVLHGVGCVVQPVGHREGADEPRELGEEERLERRCSGPWPVHHPVTPASTAIGWVGRGGTREMVVDRRRSRGDLGSGARKTRRMGEWRSWVAGAVGPGAVVVRARRLHGGVTSVVHGVDVDDVGGERHRLVLRTHPAGGHIEHEPEMVADEVRALRTLEAAGLDGVPRLVAADEDGRDAGRPAVLSTRLPGRPVLGGVDEERWVDGLADGVVRNVTALQAVDAAGLSAYRPWHEVGPGARVIPPQWAEDPAGWIRSMQAIVPAVLPSTWPHQPIHRDSNPGNLLWHRGRVTGVVDWVNLCLGPVEDDVARCRVNIWLLAGARAADRFLAATEAGGLPYDRRWDLSLISDMCHHLDGFADAAAHLGRQVTTAEVRERAQEIARSGL